MVYSITAIFSALYAQEHGHADLMCGTRYDYAMGEQLAFDMTATWKRQADGTIIVHSAEDTFCWYDPQDWT